VEYLWGYFMELNRRRGGSGFGPNPLSDELIGRWEARNRIKLSNWEYKALLAADDAYMECQSEATKLRSKGNG
jgi:hypothetical protein